VLTRRARLSPGSWTRKPKQGSPKRDMYEERIRGQRAAQAKDDALTEGCEYGSVFLLGWWKLNGCAACGRHRGVVNHHTKHRSQKGRAEWMVPICPNPCHVEDGPGIEGKALRDYDVDLYAKAEELAAAGREQGYLPVEMCEAEGCGAWHSTRFMLDDIDKATGVTRRICCGCAPEGPI
jgi:hypothetical protein